MVKQKQLTKKELETEIKKAAILFTYPFSKAADAILADIARRYEPDLYRFLRDAGLFPHETSEIWAALIRIRFVKLVCADDTETAARIRALIVSKKRTKPLEFQLIREVFRGFFLRPIQADGKPPKTPKDYFLEVFETTKRDLKRRGKNQFIPSADDFIVLRHTFQPPYFDVYEPDDFRPDRQR